jgi:hypothetical protein
MTRMLMALLLACGPVIASAQAKPAPPPKPTPAPARPQPAVQERHRLGLRGYATFGSMQFAASESFDAILGATSAPTIGGGVQVLLPWNLFAQLGAARVSRAGERVFVAPAPGREIFRLGIPVDITMTPVDITGGWRYRRCVVRPAQRRPCRPSVVPYVGAGFTSTMYSETSPFAEPDENVDERFNGVHVLGGVEYLPLRWMAVGGEVSWSSVPDAIGRGGVSAAFDEDNLGGTTIRLKISVGR